MHLLCSDAKKHAWPSQQMRMRTFGSFRNKFSNQVHFLNSGIWSAHVRDAFSAHGAEVCNMQYDCPF